MNIKSTPSTNEHQLRFEFGEKISQRQVTYVDNKQALASPVAHKIFGFPWTREVTVGDSFVEITKQDWVDKDVLEEPLQGLLEEHFKTYGDKKIEENPEPAKPKNPLLDSTEAQAILELFEHEVNPSLASHGGFVTLKAIENNTAYIEMGGGCQGCAMSYMTLKEGIETAIRQRVPSIEQVLDTTDHAKGENPFYSEEQNS